MRRLMLLRHAKSDWPKGVADHDRPLGPRGRRDAPHMGEEIALRGLRPDLAVVSSAQRTRETWDLVAPHLGDIPHRFERAIYEADPKAILAVIRAIDDAIGTLLVVGHNPGLEVTATYLIGGGAGRLRDRLGEKFPTAALAVIEFDEGGWHDIGQGRGRLALFLTPKDLD
jgi:phosphohistidine phosphatase